MSHSYGMCRFDGDGKIMWFEYNGTSDQAIPPLRESRQEVSDNWRNGQWTECTCGRDPEPVQIAQEGGDGFWWHGTACRHCKTLVGGLDPWPDEPPYSSPNDGLPDWARELSHD